MGVRLQAHQRTPPLSARLVVGKAFRFHRSSSIPRLGEIEGNGTSLCVFSGFLGYLGYLAISRMNRGHSDLLKGTRPLVGYNPYRPPTDAQPVAPISRRGGAGMKGRLGADSCRVLCSVVLFVFLLRRRNPLWLVSQHRSSIQF